MKKYLLFLVGIVSLVSFGQDGSLDTSFGDGGILQTDIDGDSDMAVSIGQQADGKLLVAGKFIMQGQEFPSIARYTLDGLLDASFSDDGVAFITDIEYQFGSFTKIMSQSNNKLIAGATFNINSEEKYIIHRFLEDGTVDTNYGDNGKIIIFPEKMYGGDFLLLNDDSLLAGGIVYENNKRKVGLKKYLANGTLDTSFGNNGIVITDAGDDSSAVIKMAFGPENSVIVFATSESNGVYSKILLRYTSDGLLDTSFGNNGLVSIVTEPDFIANNMAVYNDGKVAITSNFYDYQLEQMSNRILRYLPNGNLDTTFGSNGSLNPGINNFLIRKIEAQQNQRLLVFGELTDFFEGGGPFFMIRYKLGGYVDTSFNFNTNSSEVFVSDMILQQDGKIVCLANTAWYNGQEDIIIERHFNNPLSVPEFENQKITVYPNPSNGIFTIEREFYSEKEAYQITDVTGKIISTGELGDKQSQIDLSTAQSGVYFLRTSNSVFRLLKN
ncbi:MAG: T9SS type A sorting domain-containing protein [Aequorivita sp.]|nr:T9SS type A sorting domain-containing protein [Aequorivita sp.]